MWDLKREKVIQTADLGANNGALMVRFVYAHGVRRAFINAPATSAVCSPTTTTTTASSTSSRCSGRTTAC